MVRTRPDISVGVSVVCRLATKDPANSIEVGKNLMEYIRGNPGGLPYHRDTPKEIWGSEVNVKLPATASCWRCSLTLATAPGLEDVAPRVWPFSLVAA